MLSYLREHQAELCSLKYSTFLEWLDDSGKMEDNASVVQVVDFHSFIDIRSTVKQ